MMFRGPYRETPGSVSLQSTIPMEYSRAVLTNIWCVGTARWQTGVHSRSSRHQKREAEPKDNDINTLPVRNMHISTYKKLATDGEVRAGHSHPSRLQPTARLR